MAVGDVVNGLAANPATLTFQPAASVEVCITSVMASSAYAYLTDGVTNAFQCNGSGTNAFQSNQLNSKLMINNSIYIFIAASALNSTYTGIQIK